MTETNKSMRVLRVIRGVPIAGALFLLLSVNALLLAWSPFKHVDPESLPAVRSWVWWATQDFKHQKPAPNVVVLGSSLMMHPLWHQEAAYRNEDVDLVADHRSRYLESVIKSRLPLPELKCFNFALPGAMVSDACMIVRALCQGTHKPDIVVIGLGPRDFIDNRFNCAASSKHFQYLSRFTETRDLVDLSMPQLWQRPNYWIKDLLYLKGHAQDAQIVAAEVLRRLCRPVLSLLPASPLERVTDEDRRFASYREELEKGVWVAHPTSPYMYLDAAADCKKRFRSPNNGLFENQRDWLVLLLQTCKERGITPVMVNMPVTDVARKLMPFGVYERHMDTLRSLAARFDCALVDIDLPNRYEAEDFTDWAHMDASGGKKVLDLIGQYIGSDSQLVARLTGGARTIAGKSTGSI